MYLGPAWNLAAHRNAVAVLAVALDAPLGVALDPHDPALGYTACRTALIAPNQLHLLDTPGDQYAFLYLDASSADLRMMQGRFQRQIGAAAFDLDVENALIALLSRMDRSARGWQQECARLATVLQLHPQVADARIQAAIDAMTASPAEGSSAAQYAQQAGLSSSRFQHLFAAQTGVPFRRYRLWVRLQATVLKILAGSRYTDAAHDCGFSSSAHLSAAFKEMFGMSLTQLMRGGVLFVSA